MFLIHSKMIPNNPIIYLASSLMRDKKSGLTFEPQCLYIHVCTCIYAIAFVRIIMNIKAIIVAIKLYIQTIGESKIEHLLQDNLHF